MDKVLLKIILFLHVLVGLSVSAHAMKRSDEGCLDEPLLKRRRIELMYQPLPQRQKLFASSGLIDEIKDEDFYIENLMYEFFKKLHILAWEKNINSPEKRLAWLQTMYAIVYKAYDTAWKVGSDCAFLDSKPLKIALAKTEKQTVSSALCLAVQAAGKVVKEIDENKAFMAENDVASVHNLKIWSEIKNKVQVIVDGKIKNIEHPNANSIAVDEVFKLLLENFGEIFECAFQYYLRVSLVPERLKTEEALIEFLKNNIAEMGPAHISYIAPWLVHFMPFDALANSQRPICELLWADKYAYPNMYPLVRFLLLLRAQGSLDLDSIGVISKFLMLELTNELYEKCED